MSWRTSCTFFKIVQKVYKLELRVWEWKEGARAGVDKKRGVQDIPLPILLKESLSLRDLCASAPDGLLT